MAAGKRILMLGVESGVLDIPRLTEDLLCLENELRTVIGRVRSPGPNQQRPFTPGGSSTGQSIGLHTPTQFATPTSTIGRTSSLHPRTSLVHTPSSTDHRRAAVGGENQRTPNVSTTSSTHPHSAVKKTDSSGPGSLQANQARRKRQKKVLGGEAKRILAKGEDKENLQPLEEVIRSNEELLIKDKELRKTETGSTTAATPQAGGTSVAPTPLSELPIPTHGHTHTTTAATHTSTTAGTCMSATGAAPTATCTSTNSSSSSTGYSSSGSQGHVIPGNSSAVPAHATPPTSTSSAHAAQSSAPPAANHHHHHPLSGPSHPQVAPSASAPQQHLAPHHHHQSSSPTPPRHIREMARTEATPWQHMIAVMEQGGSDSVFTVNNHQFLNLGKVGKGGSGSVYKVLSAKMDLLAMKWVDITNTKKDTIRQFVNEIEHLKRATELKRNDRIIQMYYYEVDRESIRIILELGETDLSNLWKQVKDLPLSERFNWVRFYWEQMLRCVEALHECRIVHRDLKPANFVVCKGRLKLIDFGIAKQMGENTTKVLCESTVGTLNYMSPEALRNPGEMESGGQKLNRANDVWSLGCMLYEMVYGRPPFSQFRSMMEKMQRITDDKYQIKYSPTLPAGDRVDPMLIDTLRHCLDRDLNTRYGIRELLQHPLLGGTPATKSMSSKA